VAIVLGKTNNIGFDGYGDETFELQLPINHITISAAFSGLLISTDKGQTFISLGSGMHSFRVGLTNKIIIRSSSSWQFVAERA